MKISKLQVIVVVLAVGGAVLLFQLPKGIIKKEKEMPVNQENIEHTSSQSVEAHKPKISKSDFDNLDKLTKEYNTFLNKEKKIKFADSLTTLYRRLNQFDSAAKYAGEAAALEVSSKRLERAGDVYSEAFALATEGNKEYLNEKAREYYNKVLSISPQNLEVKSKLALTYVGGESTMQGVQILREVLKVDPKNETAIYNLGVLSLQSGQYGKAIDRFKELIRINPANANAHFYLGLSYLNSGEKRKARTALESARALENDPAFQATVETYMKEL